MAAVHHQDGVNLDADGPVEAVRIVGNLIPHGESLARGSGQVAASSAAVAEDGSQVGKACRRR
jgi:hypothetical protein